MEKKCTKCGVRPRYSTVTRCRECHREVNAQTYSKSMRKKGVDNRREQSLKDARKVLREGKKRCFSCKKMVQLELFYKVEQNRDGCDGRCIECRLAYERERRKTLPRFDLANNVRKYGLTLEQFDLMVEKQNNRCLICDIGMARGRGADGLHIDHCHESGEVRGLLCSKCNRGLGCFKDDPKITERATKYLKGKLR